jgi:peptidoglycan hydrolase-like protein with peptidoglycan-binding domain
LLSATHGTFGPLTTQRVREFQAAARLPQTGVVDAATLKKLVTTPATAPRVSQAYVTLVLDFAFAGTTRVATITMQYEGGGKFSAVNRNTDKAGLSFGLIQWAQKPGRLNELLRAFRQAAPANFVQVFGAGDTALADGLIAHTARPRGGTNNLGQSTNPRYDLVSATWIERFTAAALDPALQRAQVTCAMDAFNRSLAAIRAYAPALKSEREVAFMLDLANQHGDGGARDIFRTVAPASTGPALLVAIEEESVRRIGRQFGEGSNEAVAGRARREAFRTSVLLSDAAFSEA